MSISEHLDSIILFAFIVFPISIGCLLYWNELYAKGYREALGYKTKIRRSLYLYTVLLTHLFFPICWLYGYRVEYKGYQDGLHDKSMGITRIPLLKIRRVTEIPPQDNNQWK